MRRKKRVDTDLSPMGVALALAVETARLGNVPVGAVVVHDGAIVGRGANLRHVTQDPSAHAELLALRDAAQRLGTWRLNGASMYVTLEPCAMCAGAITQARLARLLYAVEEPRMGAVTSRHGLLDDGETEVVALEAWRAPCEEALEGFFKGLRAGRRRR